ncbi:MAG: hypothetical protein ACT4PW_10050 [Acidimicrobiia bacterium]
MVICCWSSKGGVGTTVVAASLALVLARARPPGAVLADLAGDAPMVLGLPDDPADPGLAGWLDAGEGVPTDGLARLEAPVGAGLALIRRGTGPLSPGRAEVLAGLLAADPRPVVVDAGTLAPGAAGGDVARVMAAGATQSLLVLRPCFVALRRAVDSPIRPSGVVLVAEEGRVLSVDDIEDALGVPVRATVRVTPQVARVVDAGLLLARLPRTLASDLRHAA